MKTERRHELQTNVLADALGHYGEQLRPYAKHFAAVVVAVVAIVAISGFFVSDQTSRSSIGWADYFAASNDVNPDPARLRAVAQQHQGTPAGLWAKLTEADTELARGMRLLYTDRDAANEALDQAVSSYESVVEGLADEPQLQASARFGLAQALECSGRISKAIEAYEAAAGSGAGSGLAARALARKEELEKSDVKKFYNWFAKQKPVPPMAPGALPGLGSPPVLPPQFDLPDESNLQFPPVGEAADDETTEAPAPADGSSDTETPAPESSEAEDE